MTNYYCESWTTVDELTAEQVDWLVKFRDELGDIEDGEQADPEFDECIESYLNKVGCTSDDEYFYDIGDFLNFDVEKQDDEDGAVTIGHSEAFTPDHAAEFLKIFLSHFRLDRHIVIEWAGYPSRQMSGAYYGGAALITLDEIYWFIPGQSAQEKSDTLRRESEKES